MPEQKSEACATPLAAPPAEKPVLYAESSQEQTTVRI